MARLPITQRRTVGIASLVLDAAPEGASETFVGGAVLVADGSGRLQEAGADPTVVAGVAATAGHDNATEGAATVQYVPVRAGVRFEGSVDTSASLGAGASALTDLFVAYGITEDSNGVWYVDKTKVTTDARVLITRLVDPASVNGRVEFEFLAAHMIGNDG